MSLLQEALDACAALTRRVEHLEHDKVAQDLEIIKLKTRVKKLERANKGRMIDELDRDEGIKLMGEKDEKKKDIANDDQAERRHAEIQAEKQADISNRHGSCCKSFDAPVSAASTIIPAAELNIPAVTITAALVKVAVASTRRRRGVSKEQIEEEENRALEIINETPAQKAAKRRRLNQEDKDVEEIKQHLEIMPDEDDDVYTEATPMARKDPVVDYQIILLNNKPRYKIIKADGTHQLYTSFITMLKNFDREDLETLWSIVKKDQMDKTMYGRVKEVSMVKQWLKAGSC
nr:hypothetical protein [Tanacetum cinerariifolium]